MRCYGYGARTWENLSKSEECPSVIVSFAERFNLQVDLAGVALRCFVAVPEKVGSACAELSAGLSY